MSFVKTTAGVATGSLVGGVVVLAGLMWLLTPSTPRKKKPIKHKLQIVRPK